MTAVSEPGAGISVIIPVFNAEERLELVAQRVRTALAGRDFELVFVNDGSSDKSWDAIEAMSPSAEIRGLDLMRNYGQHNALLAGIRAATKPLIVTIDDDLQNPPEEIDSLLSELRLFDLVYGTPSARQHGLIRNLGTTLAKAALATVIGRDNARKVSAFRAFRTELREAFADFAGSYVSIDVLLSWGARNVTAVTVAHDPRVSGRSGYSFVRLVTHAMNVLTGFSTRPLRFASVLGLVSTLFGLAVLAAVIIRYFTVGNPVPGFAFLASLISIFSGAQLVTLGIIGEYLARMHVRIMDRPPYVIRRSVEAGRVARP